jgi:MFS family permease
MHIPPQVAGEASAELGRTTLAKVGWRLLPFLLLLYVVAWLDRVNIGFAALQMNEDLGFSSAVYGFGAGVFFIGYALFEIPSNLILARVGARLWIARIMITWGVLSIAMMFVSGALSFYVLRFLLGVAEAGLPGIIYYSVLVSAAERPAPFRSARDSASTVVGRRLAVAQLNGWHTSRWQCPGQAAVVLFVVLGSH